MNMIGTRPLGAPRGAFPVSTKVHRREGSKFTGLGLLGCSTFASAYRKEEEEVVGSGADLTDTDVGELLPGECERPRRQ